MAQRKPPEFGSPELSTNNHVIRLVITRINASLPRGVGHGWSQRMCESYTLVSTLQRSGIAQNHDPGGDGSGGEVSSAGVQATTNVTSLQNWEIAGNPGNL